MTQNNLFELIQSLSKSEKRYFSLNLGKKDSNHFKLYQLIKKMKVYDDEPVKAMFGKHWSAEKNNLYSLILKCMRHYRCEKSAYFQIKEMTFEAQFLMEKGLHIQSLRWLRKAKHLAIKYERNNDILEIGQLEGTLLLQIKPEDLKEQINLLGEEQKKILIKIKEESQYLNTYHSITTKFFQHINLSTKEQKSDFTKEFSLEEKDISSFSSPRASYSFLLYKKFHFQLLGKSQGVFDYSFKIMEWWEDNQGIKKEERHRYLVDHFNYLAACFIIKDYERILPTLNKLEKEPTENALEKRILFQGLIQYRHLYYMNIGDFETAKKEYLKVEEELKKIDLDEKNRTTIIANFAVLLFFMEDFDNSIQAIDAILKNKNVTKRLGVQRFARVLKCICYLELEDISGFESAYRAAKRFLVETKEDDKSFEHQILGILKELESATYSEVRGIYENTEVFLREKKNNPNKNDLLGLEEYVYWIESKLKKVPMTKLLLDNLPRNY